MSVIEYYRPSAGDVESLFKLEKLCFPSPWDKEEIKALVQSEPLLYTLGAFDKGKAVGYISGTISKKGTLHIISLCVHPDYRRRGIAVSLCSHTVHWGRHMDACKVVLEVREENSAARQLYRGLSFSEKGILQNFYGENSHGVLLEKTVEPFGHSLNTSLFLYNRLKTTPRIGVILGSGLGWVTQPFGSGQSIPFSEIPGMAGEAVEGHSLTLQTSENGEIVFVMGRRHLYQGYSGREIALLPSALAALGVGTWVLTSSAGAVDTSYKVGDAMVFTDHINFSGCIPDLPGHCIAGDVYSDSLQAVAKRCMTGSHTGVFACVSGPAYETAAEVELIRNCGASAVSMSTVQEALALRSLGCRVLAMALITNATDSGDSVCHDEVLSAQETVRAKQEGSLVRLLEGLLK